MTEPLVSVKMLTYNHKDYIAKAIESVLTQQVDFKYELLIGEDCSTDGTREIVFDYQKKYPEIIRVITSKSNVGMMANSLRLLNAARGKYVAHCEGDDYWCSPNKLQKQIDIMEADPEITLCFHNVNFLYSNGNGIKKQFPQRTEDRFYETKDVILKGGEFYKVVSALIRRSIYDDIPDWYLKAPVGDWAISLLSALKGKVFYLNDVMAVYRSGIPQSWTEKMQNDSDKYKEHLFKSMKVRKSADIYSNHKYQKYFGRRIGQDIKWLMTFTKLSNEEYKYLENEYFNLLSAYDRMVITSMKTVNFDKCVLLLRKLKKTFSWKGKED